MDACVPHCYHKLNDAFLHIMSSFVSQILDYPTLTQYLDIERYSPRCTCLQSTFTLSVVSNVSIAIESWYFEESDVVF